MTVTDFLDLKLEKDTHDIIVKDKNGNILKGIDYDTLNILNVTYIKIAVIIDSF